tara:strand:+ start:451 stop:915 length:465 start_codon:yes stop_codon:yes gene_type:complete
MKLIKCSDYVIEQKKVLKRSLSLDDYFLNIDSYANFLKRPLELGMFIPCDKDGNVLKELERFEHYQKYGEFGLIKGYEFQMCKQYQEAKERVIFEGNWEHSRDDRYTHMNWMTDMDSPTDRIGRHEMHIRMHECKTIEDLTELGLTLTKQIETI